MSKNEVVNWEDQFASQATEVAAMERNEVATIGFAGGQMTYAGTEIPDNSITGVAAAYVMEHVYYEDRYDSDNLTPPTCFSKATPVEGGRDGRDMIPHADVPNPVNKTCHGCPKMEWGSSENGKGKACKQIRRIAFLPVNQNATPEQIAGAEVGIAKIPVTSVKNWKSYITGCAGSLGRPTWSVMTNMSVAKHPKFQLEVSFDNAGVIEGQDQLSAINARVPELEEMLLTPYSYEEDSKPKSKKY